MDKTYKVVMVRHGESVWKDYFCGWYDAKLNQKGEEDAVAAGKALKDAGYRFDVGHTSALTRAQRTLACCLHEISQTDIRIEKAWRLNPRHYGHLTGISKRKAVVTYGEAQVATWRHGFTVPAPPMDEGHPFYNNIVRNAQNWPAPKQCPMFESLQMTFARVLPYWHDVIVPQIKDGKHILIAAHGSSLRAIVQHLDQLSDKEIVAMELPSGIPFVYELDDELKPVQNGSLQFVGDEETVKKAKAILARQGQIKPDNVQ